MYIYIYTYFPAQFFGEGGKGKGREHAKHQPTSTAECLQVRLLAAECGNSGIERRLSFDASVRTAPWIFHRLAHRCKN